jgi:hypothetical protein
MTIRADDLDSKMETFEEKVLEYLNRKKLVIAPPHLEDNFAPSMGDLKRRGSKPTMAYFQNLTLSAQKKKGSLRSIGWYQIERKTFPVELLGLEAQLGRAS